jgi:hypothetical protein
MKPLPISDTLVAWLRIDEPGAALRRCRIRSQCALQPMEVASVIPRGIWDGDDGFRWTGGVVFSNVR